MALEPAPSFSSLGIQRVALFSNALDARMKRHSTRRQGTVKQLLVLLYFASMDIVYWEGKQQAWRFCYSTAIIQHKSVKRPLHGKSVPES